VKLHSPESLASRQSIYEVIAKHCRGLDRLDLDTIRRCYHEDASIESGPFKGNLADFLVWVAQSLEAYATTMHFITNHVVELMGDMARAETHVLVFHTGQPYDDPDLNITQVCRYVDELNSRDGIWRIASRVCVTESSLVVQPDDRQAIPSGIQVGARGEADIIYHL